MIENLQKWQQKFYTGKNNMSPSSESFFQTTNTNSNPNNKSNVRKVDLDEEALTNTIENNP